jgi:hypothetical protein
VQIDLIYNKILHAPVYRVIAREEAALNPVRDLAKSQVKARRLDIGCWDFEVAGVHNPISNRGADVLAREYPRTPRREI